MRISESLVITGGKTACAGCGHELAKMGTPWKQHATLKSQPVRTLPGAGTAIEEKVVLRLFSCPGCGALLDTETAMPEDPFLEDLPCIK
jgi:acetone carboxylase gamma subunit